MFVRDGTGEKEEKEKGGGKERRVPDSLYRGKTREWRRDCGWTLLSTWRWKNDRYHRCRRRAVVGKGGLSESLLLETRTGGAFGS